MADPTPGARFIAAIPNGWRAGMLADCGSRGRVRITDVLLFAENYLTPYGYGWTKPVPDLNDPATRGAAVEVLREVSGEGTLHPQPFQGGWYVDRDHDALTSLQQDGTWGGGERPFVWAETEPEATAAAAEALARKPS